MRARGNVLVDTGTMRHNVGTGKGTHELRWCTRRECHVNHGFPLCVASARVAFSCIRSRILIISLFVLLTGWRWMNTHCLDEFCSDCVFSFRIQTLVRFTSLDLCSLSSLHDLRRLENQHFSGISSLYRHRCRCRRCWGSYSETHHIGSTVAHWTLRTIGHFCYRCSRIFRFWIRTIRKSASNAFSIQLEKCTDSHVEGIFIGFSPRISLRKWVMEKFRI